MLKLFTRLIVFALVTFALAPCTWAATLVGRVSSSQSFKLNGTPMPVEGVPSWPLYAGDVIVTQAAQATIVFRNGSRVVLEPNSELKVEIKDKKPVVRLLRGNGKYFIAGTVVALSTAAAVSLGGASGNGGLPDVQGPNQPPNPSAVKP